MALFGDLGKALGLGSGEDLLPLIGTAAGFYFAPALGLSGAMGSALGSGLGSLAGGKSVNDALTNAALSYGVTSFLSPSMTKNLQMAGGQGSPASALQSAIYNVPTSVAKTAITPANLGTISDADLYDVAMSDAGKAADSGSIFGSIKDFVTENKMLSLGIAGGLLAGGEPQDDTKEGPDIRGEAHKVPYRGVEYDLRNPDDIRAYKEAKMETQRPDFKYDVESVYAKHGGAMYEHGIEHPAERGDYTGEVAGAGTGTSDSVPAWLSDGEFVLTAKAVKGAGGGDRDIGAARMYDMMAELEATA